MMKNSISSIIVRIRPTNNTNQRQIFRVRAGDRIQYTKSADGERDNTRADATRPGIAVGGVSGIEFVTAADVIESRLGD